MEHRKSVANAAARLSNAFKDVLGNEAVMTPELSQAYQDARQLQERVRELEADANRYRWIRQAGAWESELGIDELSKDPAKFDAAVDEQIAADALAKREAG